MPPRRSMVQRNSPEGLKKRLEEQLRRPENQICADCPTKQPRWASPKLGVFMCIECSGIHRNLGTHISFVRSINLDTWTPEQVEKMEQWGNQRAKRYYEAEVPANYRVPSEGASVREVQRWIRDKYEFRRFIPSDGSVPEPDAPAPAAAPRRSKPSMAGAAAAVTATQRVAKPAAAAAAPVSQPVAAPKPVAAPQPVAQAVPDLLDFSEPAAPPPAPAAPSAAPAGFSAFDQAPQPAFGQQPAFPGQAAPQAPAQFPGQQPMPQQQQQMTPAQPPAPPAAPAMSNDNIMAMFNAPAGGMSQMPPMQTLTPQMAPQMAPQTGMQPQQMSFAPQQQMMQQITPQQQQMMQQQQVMLMQQQQQQMMQMMQQQGGGFPGFQQQPQGFGAPQQQQQQQQQQFPSMGGQMGGGGFGF